MNHPTYPQRDPVSSAGNRVGRRLLWLGGVTVFLIFCWSRSLLLTSEPVDPSQRQLVMQAIRVIDTSGFSREATMLRNFANFRTTDNWWNLSRCHREAYAATNFPLGVVTLYPPFFQIATDDTERAAILFHEAQHLMGAGEESALARTWREKGRFGWTVEKYGHTRVWRNTSEWTAAAVPSLVP